jgi:hypothetical protein
VAAFRGAPGLLPEPKVILMRGSPKLPWQSWASRLFKKRRNTKNVDATLKKRLTDNIFK